MESSSFCKDCKPLQGEVSNKATSSTDNPKESKSSASSSSSSTESWDSSAERLKELKKKEIVKTVPKESQRKRPRVRLKLRTAQD